MIANMAVSGFLIVCTHITRKCERDEVGDLLCIDHAGLDAVIIVSTLGVT